MIGGAHPGAMNMGMVRGWLLTALRVGSVVSAIVLMCGVPAARAADGTLSGTVTEAGSGTPLAGVSVRAFCWQVTGSGPGEVCGEAQTAGDGTYSLALAEGTYKVEFDHWPHHDRQFHGGGSDLSSPDSLTVTVAPGAATTGIDAALVPLRTVTGTVTGDGELLHGINVTAYQLSGGPFAAWEPVQGTVTEPGGTYALHLAAGTYRVGFRDVHGPYGTVFYDGAASVEQAGDIVVAGGTVTGIDADLAAEHPVTGTVTVDGVNMPDVTVTAYRQGTGGGWDAVEVTETGSEGTYALFLPDGTYRVEFKTWQARFDTVYYDGAGSLEDATDVVVAGTEVPEINATILSEAPQSGPAITGTVSVSGSGDAAPGISATAWRWDVAAGSWRPVRQAFAGPDGTYALYVPEGLYRVGFRDGENRYQALYYDGARTIEDASDVIVTQDGAPGVDAAMVANHSIGGLVTADAHPELPPGGVPPTQVTAYRFDEGSADWERAADTFAGPDGRYRLYVPDGTYRIGFAEFFGAYRQPLFYDGVEDVADAKDVVVAGADVSGIDARLVLETSGPPPTWPATATLSGAGQDAWHPRVAVGPDGATIAVWYRRVGGHTRVEAARRPEGGAFSPVLVSEAGSDASDPEVAVGARGTTVAVWRSWDGARFRVKAATMSSKGVWSSPVTLSGAGDAWDARVAVGAKGNAVVTWRKADAAGSSIQGASRAPNGTWSSPVTLSATRDGWDPQVAAGADGTAVVAWSQSDQAQYRVHAASLSATGSWSPPVALSAAGGDAWDPQVAAGPDGQATAVWRRRDGAHDRIQAASRTRAGTWSAPVALSSAGQSAYEPQVASSPGGTMTAVWARWDGSTDRVQTASQAPGEAWSSPVTVSRAGQAARSPQVTAGADGAATVAWRQSDGFSEWVQASTRPPGGAWATPAKLTHTGDRAKDPRVASGPDGTVAAVWEVRDGADDRVQGVVRTDPLGRNATECRNEFGVDLNVLFDVPEQFVYGGCTSVTAGARWRPLSLWYVNTLYDAVPPGFIPAGTTPLEDLKAKLKAVKVVIDRGTSRQSTVVVSPEAALRTDRSFRDFSLNDYPYPMAVTIPRMAPLRPGEHKVEVVWTLIAQHCDGFTDVEEYSCLPSGDVPISTRRFSVVSP